jgi:hypothetical protein
MRGGTDLVVVAVDGEIEDAHRVDCGPGDPQRQVRVDALDFRGRTGRGRALNVPMRTLPILLLVLSACSATSTAPTPEAQKRAETFQVLPLQYSSASELASTLSSLFSRNPEVRVMSDMRTNSLVIMGDADDITRIESLVHRIDVEVKPTH